MLAIQLPFEGVLWAMFIYLFLENFSKILKKPLDNDDTYGIIKGQAQENNHDQRRSNQVTREDYY